MPRHGKTQEQPIFTIGHSTRPLDVFLELLRINGVKRVGGTRLTYPTDQPRAH